MHKMQVLLYPFLQNQSVFPDMQWSREEDELTGTLTLQLDREPLSIRGWWADTTNVTVEMYDIIDYY